MPIINRCLSERNCERAKADLGFLIGYLELPRFRGELAIEFRGSSELSVYDRGLRLAQVRFSSDGDYQVSTHRRFIEGTPLEASERFPAVLDTAGNYATFRVTSDSIHGLLQAQHIAAMRSRIKRIPSKEELGIAHVIAADTTQGTDVVVIDREVGDSATEHRGERLDLLALQQVAAESSRRV